MSVVAARAGVNHSKCLHFSAVGTDREKSRLSRCMGVGRGHDLLGKILDSCLSVPLRGKEEKGKVWMPKLRMVKEYKDKRKSIDDVERSGFPLCSHF